MSTDDDAILMLMRRMSWYKERKKEMDERHIFMLSEGEKKVSVWNCDINKAVSTSGKLYIDNNEDNDIPLIMDKHLQIFSSFVNEFNQTYQTEGALVEKYDKAKLNIIYKCVAQVLSKFNIIQNKHCVTKAINNELEYLVQIITKIMVRFRELIIYCHMKLMEDTRNHENQLEKMHKEQLKSKVQVEEIIVKQDKEKSYYPEDDLIRESHNPQFKRKIEFLEPEITNTRESVKDINCEAIDLINQSENVEEIFHKIFSFDRNYCHNIRKMVNNVCCQITSSNPQHTINILHQILNFLQGNSIALVGSDNKVNINLKGHSEALELFWYLFYRAVLIQAETQFAVNIDTTVTFASVVNALFGRFPERLEGLLKLIFERYPVFVGQRKLFVDDDQSLAALKGVSRFVAALLVSAPPTGFRSCERLSVSYLWSMLAQMESNDVQESVSSEAFNGLLEIGGFTLLHTYKDQFMKIMMVIKQKFQPLSGINEIALVLAIDDVIQKKSFEIRGCLDKQYWSS